MRIDYDDSFRTGIETVDQQHQILVALYNDLDEAVWQGKAHHKMQAILAQLYKYTKTHFADEEAILRAVDYPDFAQHQFEHQRLAERLKGFVVRYRKSKERISDEMLEFVRKWILAHIKECDLAYVAHVQKNAHRLTADTRGE